MVVVRGGSTFPAGGIRLPLRPRFLALAAVLLMAVVYGGRELYLRLTHIYEYDARATADIVTVSSRADGWVMEMPALRGTRLAAGQVGARLCAPVAQLPS